METRFRTNVFGKLILQVLEIRESKYGTPIIKWRDAGFQDYQLILQQGTDMEEQGDDEKETNKIGF